MDAEDKARTPSTPSTIRQAVKWAADVIAWPDSDAVLPHNGDVECILIYTDGIKAGYVRTFIGRSVIDAGSDAIQSRVSRRRLRMSCR